MYNVPNAAEELKHSTKEELAKKDILKNWKNKELKEISDEECLFNLPSSWSWIRLGEL